MTTGPVAPWWDTFRSGYDFDSHFDDDEHRRRALLHYHALCSFADANLGRILDALDDSGLADSTNVIFLSDHGDNMGARGLWGKSTMYRESVNVPLILAGPGIAGGRVCNTPVSLIDMQASALDAFALGLPVPREFTSRSLWRIARAPAATDRPVFCEYHASCARSALYMIREGRFKYIHYTGFGCELFDLKDDPGERHDLSGDPRHATIVTLLEARLRAVLVPEAVDARAKADQRARAAELGGMAAIVAKGGVPHTPAPSAPPFKARSKIVLESCSDRPWPPMKTDTRP